MEDFKICPWKNELPLSEIKAVKLDSSTCPVPLGLLPLATIYTIKLKLKPTIITTHFINDIRT